MNRPPDCERCRVPAKLLTSSEAVYEGRDYGPVWVCGNFPACDARCGCHRGTHKPLGTLADRPTRDLRKKCHAAFDPIWKTGGMSRHKAYERLAELLGIERDECHIGMFTTDQCRQTLAVIEQIKHPSVKLVGRNYVPSTENTCPF